MTKSTGVSSSSSAKKAKKRTSTSITKAQSLGEEDQTPKRKQSKHENHKKSPPIQSSKATESLLDEMNSSEVVIPINKDSDMNNRKMEKVDKNDKDVLAFGLIPQTVSFFKKSSPGSVSSGKSSVSSIGTESNSRSIDDSVKLIEDDEEYIDENSNESEDDESEFKSISQKLSKIRKNIKEPNVAVMMTAIQLILRRMSSSNGISNNIKSRSRVFPSELGKVISFIS